MEAWESGKGDGRSDLFDFCANDGVGSLRNCGCLTMVRYNDCVAEDHGGKVCKSLTAAIAGDERIPNVCIERFQQSWANGTLPERRAILTVFADWQRAMDATIRQGKPWHPEFSPTKQVTA